MAKLVFPKGFWWGGATSGPQTEGDFDKPNISQMDYWFKQRPQDFFNGVGPVIASDFYHKYEEDFKMMKDTGMNSFRTSIQWTRLIKNIATGEVDDKGRAFYDKMINAALKNDILPIMNLFHFDLPIDLQNNKNGWVSRETVELFVKYARTAFDLFGDRVKYWAVINEPGVLPDAGYLYGFHYPNYVGKGIDAVQVMYNLVLATAKTVKTFKESTVGKNGGKICTILNLTPAYTATDSDEDVKAGKFVDDFFNNSFVEPAVTGEFPKGLVEVLEKDGVLWKSKPEDKETIKNNTVDFLGINYYQPKRVQARKNPLPPEFSKEWMPDKYFESYDWKEKRMNPYRGWEIYPKAIYDIAINMKNKYPNMPWFVSENGMGVEGEEKYINKDGIIEDDYRIEFYEEHLTWLHKAIQEGSNCIGYHAWAALDCWSWNNAYKNRYGFLALDLKTQKRTIKKSGYWLKEVVKNNGFGK